jgi:hypothetical protein
MPHVRARVPPCTQIRTGKFEDPIGTELPAAAVPYCDAWKRPEELLQGGTSVPLLCTRTARPDPERPSSKGGCEMVAQQPHLSGHTCARPATVMQFLNPPGKSPLFLHQLAPFFTMCTHPAAAAGSKAAAAGLTGAVTAGVLRECEGRLYAGLECFEWMLAAFSQVMAAEVC